VIAAIQQAIDLVTAWEEACNQWEESQT
jgi:hypothetical protein